MEKNKISLFKAVMMGVNIMVGAGILAAPEIMSKLAGGSSFLIWLLCAVIMLPIVYTVARLPEAIPGQGGFVAYYKAGMGRIGGFVGGWLYLLCYVFAAAGVLVAFSSKIGQIFPSLACIANPPLFVALALVVVFAYNMLPLTTIASISSVLTIVKLIPVLGAIVFLPFFLKNLPAVKLNEVAVLPSLVGLSLFAMVGFESLTSLADVIEGGAKAARKAVLLTFLSVAGLYMLFHLSLISIMGVGGLVRFGGTGYAAFVAEVVPFLGQAIIWLLPFVTVVTFMNGSAGLALLDSLTLETLGKDNMIRFSKTIARPLPNGRPLLSVVLSSLAIYATAMAVNDVAGLFKGTALISMSLISIVMIILAKLECGKKNYFDRAIGAIAIVLALGIALYIISDLGVTRAAKMAVINPILIGLGVGLLVAKYCALIGEACYSGICCKSQKNNCPEGKNCNDKV